MLALVKASPIGFDELDLTRDELVGCSLLTILTGPLILINPAGDADAGALMQVLHCQFRQLVESSDPDPGSFVFPGFDSDVE